MTSGNTAPTADQTPETTSGNTNARRGRQPVALHAHHDQALTAYTEALTSAPIAESSKAKYASRVRGFLAWLADTDVDGDMYETDRRRSSASPIRGQSTQLEKTYRR